MYRMTCDGLILEYRLILGPKDTTCSACKSKGIQIAMSPDSPQLQTFESKSPSIQIKASSKIPLSLQLPMDVDGGQITGLLNKNGISLKIRTFMKLGRMVSRVKKGLGAAYLKASGILDSKFRPVKQMLSSIHRLTRESNVDYQQFFKDFEKLKMVSGDLEITVKGLLQGLESDGSKKQTISLVKFLLRRLKQIRETNILPKISPLKLKRERYILSFQGRLCVHQICFTGLDFSLSNHCRSCDSGASADKMGQNNVKGTANSDLIFSKKLYMAKDQKLHLSYNESSDTITGSSEVMVKLKSGVYKGTISFDEGVISLTVKDVTVLGSLKMSLSKTERLENATWEGLTDRMSGSSSTTSDMVRSINLHSQTYFTEISKETKLRLLRADDNEKKSLKQLAIKVRESEKLEKLSKIADFEVRRNDLLLEKELGQLNESQFILNREIPEISAKFIQRNVESICKLQECEKKCISLPHCDICQDPIHVSVKVPKCHTVKRTIKTRQTLTYTTKCDIKKKVFIPVYTGTCPQDPNPHLKRRLFGLGLGWMVGGPVGGIFGFFFGGLFSSCDKSYIVKTRVFYSRVNCVKFKNVVKKTVLESSECMDVDKTIKAGYGEPKDCNCVVDSCFAKVEDSSCLFGNEICRRSRLKALEKTSNLPHPKYAKKYKDIQNLKRSVKLKEIVLETSKQKQKERNEEYQRAEVLLNHFKQNHEITKETRQALRDMLKTEICISAHFEKSENVNSLMYTSDLETVIRDGDIDNMKLVAKIIRVNENKIIDVPLIMDVSDVETSIKVAGKRLVREVLCPGKRRRKRSINEEVNEVNYVLPFTSWLTDNTKNLTQSESACITVQKSMKFLKEVTARLSLQMNQAELLSKQIDQTRIGMKSVNEALDVIKDGDSIIEANRDAFSSINDSARIYEKRSRPSEIIKQWLINSELYTKLNNLTHCSGFMDCMGSAFKSIRELPPITIESQQNASKYMDSLESMINNLVTGEEANFDKVRSTIYGVKSTIALVLKNDLHCEKLPTAAILPLKDEMNVVAGESVKLTCNVTSTLPTDTFWRFGEKYLDAVGKYLVFNAGIHDSGLYSCIARNAIGMNTSDAVMLNVNVLPRILEQPQNFTLIKPILDGSIQPYFECNVTAIPNATIEWFFTPFGEIQAEKLDSNLSVLIINNATMNSAGEYFCRAKNEFGMVRSRIARLDVLQSQLASQIMTFSFEFKSNDIHKLDSLSFINVIKNSTMKDKVKTKFTIKDVDTGKLELRIEHDFEDQIYKSKDIMFDEATKTRQNLAKVMAAIINDITRANLTVKSDGGDVIAVDRDSMASSFLGNVCRSGYLPSDDGFTCCKCFSVYCSYFLFYCSYLCVISLSDDLYYICWMTLRM